MKKFKIGLIILSLFISTNIVKAETIIQEIKNSHTDPFTNYQTIYNTVVIDHINDYNYYAIDLEQPYNGTGTVVFFDNIEGLSFDISSYLYSGFIYEGLTCNFNNECNETTDRTFFALTVGRLPDIYYRLYDTNYSLINDIQDIELTGFYEDNIVIEQGKSFPTLKNLYEYNSWSDYENNHLENYTEVNLDNYEYVLLTLKDYNQTQAFQTNLQVKGQIGITPIYNYGQTSKDAITGNQVQDRCNLSYDNYTSYPFYILQTDLQNNVIYAVKECSENSSFKFNNTIFNITYITTENEENPTVVIGGKTYNVIPYDDLPSTATKNEEDNYIPGESENAITGNTVGLNAILKNAQAKMGEMWETLTYFTGFIGQIFSILPSEIHAILISAFAIMIILGVIKIFLGK